MIIDPGRVREFAVRSTSDSALLVFGFAGPLRRKGLPEFKPDVETHDGQLLEGPAELAFLLHTAVDQDYFNRRRALAGAA